MNSINLELNKEVTLQKKVVIIVMFFLCQLHLYQEL